MTDLTQLTNIDRHLIPAYHAWLTENNLTPFVTVAYGHPDLDIPSHLTPHEEAVALTRQMGLVRLNTDYQILNLSYNAADSLHFGEQGISFNARFNGRSFGLYLPYEAILSMYAREDQKLAHFTVREVDITKLKGGVIAQLRFDSSAPAPQAAPTPKANPFQVVGNAPTPEVTKTEVTQSAEKTDVTATAPTNAPKRRAHLSVVK